MTNPSRSLIRISGDDRIPFLQGIVTQDVTKLNDDKIQFAALLSPQGKILHDMFLIAVDNAILIDTQSEYKDTLLKRLMMYKLRAKVTIEELSPEATAALVLTPLADPRHPELLPYSPLTTHYSPLHLGIPELGRDFLPDTVVALDAGYDLLNAVSFTKGCYVGQEITARMHYKSIARRGFFILEHDTKPMRLTLVKFEEVFANGASPVTCQPSPITINGITYRATLPPWMQPKLVQFKNSRENQ